MTFTLNNLHGLLNVVGSSSKSNDMLPNYLNQFKFVDRYTTDDDSVVFVCGDSTDLEIEFFDIGDVYKRTLSIMYQEPSNGRLTILEWDDLKRMY